MTDINLRVKVNALVKTVEALTARVEALEPAELRSGRQPIGGVRGDSARAHAISAPRIAAHRADEVIKRRATPKIDPFEPRKE